MPDGATPILIKVATSMKEVEAAQWDACAGSDNPFVSHAFLSALEDGKAATAETGWLAQHLLLEGQNGQLLGAVPLYLKNHSYGEYVFDWGWADAYQRAGGRYYPKLQCAVPFTPVTGPRLLIRPEAERDAIADALIAGLTEIARRHEVSSLHVTFPTREEWQRFGSLGFLQRIGRQYHWTNEGYESFDDFLGRMVSRKRKAIRKERRQVVESGIELTALTGDAIQERHWDSFYRFYLNTVDKKWASAYLTREFFHLLGERLGDKVVLIVAEAEGRPVAGALNLRGGDTLYGRNWGCALDYRFLHFEACYYQGIDYAIAHGLRRVEAGAQ
ncbi:MAG: GNAT family N-acetyltransferase, partial [Tistlia sp.]